MIKKFLQVQVYTFYVTTHQKKEHYKNRLNVYENSCINKRENESITVVIGDNPED